MLPKSFTMDLGAITLVPGKTIAGIQLVHTLHDAITGSLGDDRRSTDRRHDTVAPDKRFTLDETLVKSQVGQPIAIDLDSGRRYRKPEDGATHGQHCRSQDIDSVYFGSIRPGHGPGDRSPLDLRREVIAMRRSQFLGIIQPLDAAVRVEYYGSGDNGPGQWPATSLVDTGHMSIKRK
jgi:hypothetical protein